MVHLDYQHDPTLLPQIICPIEDGQYDAVFGSRMKRVSFLSNSAIFILIKKLWLSLWRRTLSIYLPSVALCTKR
jgi:hypothetical protein